MESIKRLENELPPSFDTLARMYNYTPRVFSDKELGAKSDVICSLESISDSAFGRSIDEFLKIAPKDDKQSRKINVFGVFELSEPAADDRVELVVSSVKDVGDLPKLELTINHKNLKTKKRESVAEFIFACNQESNAHVIWDLRHRIVHPPYREQGIATQIIKKFETQCARLANEQNKIQFILLSVAQANVLDFFLKRGFEPSTALDQDRVRRLFSGDPRLTIMDSPKEPSRRAYIFDRHLVYDEKGDELSDIWQIDKVRGYARFLSEAFRVSLKKAFVPDEILYDRVRRALEVKS